jgi:2-oxoisovalerate dehydrogenase E2 component (dihydrolipoyl transacylase)
MPQLGESVTEGTIAQWLKKPGDSIEKYEPFVEISTDKVTAEMPAPVSGVLKEIIVKEGDTVPTGAPIAVIDEVSTASENPQPVAPPAERAQPAEAKSTPPSPPGLGKPNEPALSAPSTPVFGEPRPEKRPPHPSPQPARPTQPARPPSRPFSPRVPSRNGGAINPPEVLRRVSPAVRRLARENNIDLTTVRGTGEHGRITANDVLAAAGQGPAAAMAAGIMAAAPLSAPVAAPPAQPPAQSAVTPTAPRPPSAPSPPGATPPRPEAPATPGRSTYDRPVPGTLIPLSQARKIIAQRMVESKHTAPHAWTMVEVDVTELWNLRQREKDRFQREKGYALTLLPFFIHAVVQSLKAYPLMNARFTDEGIQVLKELNVGIAVAVASNLMVPVIRQADNYSIAGLAVEAGKLIEKARAGKLGADDLTGGTFTVNNTGANGSIMSAPILNSGQAGIVTMEAVVKRPVVVDDDKIAIRSMMNVCLSLDHRIVDGAIASAFLVDLKKRLQETRLGTSL